METAFENIEKRKYFVDVPDIQHLADVGHLCASAIFLPNMWVVDGTYRYGFNGKEGDHTLKGDNAITQDSKVGTGNSYDFGARMYDPRLGRWFSRDAFSELYPDLSPFVGMGNNPIIFTDPDGNIIKPLKYSSWFGLKTNYALTNQDYSLQFISTSIKLINKISLKNNIYFKVLGQLKISKKYFEYDHRYIGKKKTKEYEEIRGTGGQFIPNIGDETNPNLITFHTSNEFGILPEAVVEETFHAGQDLFYKNKISDLQSETEARIARAYMGVLQPGYETEWYNNNKDVIDKYFGCLKNNLPIPQTLLDKFKASVKELSVDVYEQYKHLWGSGSSEYTISNDPKDYNGGTQYFDSLTNPKIEQDKNVKPK